MGSRSGLYKLTKSGLVSELAQVLADTLPAADTDKDKTALLSNYLGFENKCICIHVENCQNRKKIIKIIIAYLNFRVY